MRPNASGGATSGPSPAARITPANRVLSSITICAFTTDTTEAPLFRLLVEPNERNGLRTACRLMADKMSTVPRSKVGARAGRLDDEDIVRLNQAVPVFLGLAVSPRTNREA